MAVFIASAVLLGIVLLYGCLGELISEKGGHLNLGLPGVMCVGAACGYLFLEKYYLANTNNMNGFVAVIGAVFFTFLGGALCGTLYSFFTVTLKCNQNVVGLSLTTLGIGVSKYLVSYVKDYSVSKTYVFFKFHFSFLDKLGWFSTIFLSYGFLTYLCLILTVITFFVLKKTRVGLNLRAVGENPASADSVGINVGLYRYLATIIGCGISGLGGLTYIMDYLNGNWEYQVDAFGWLALALVIFVSWKPLHAILGAILFGGLYIVSFYINGISIEIKEIFKMIPYVITIIVLIISSILNKTDNQPPQSLGINYFREDR